MPNINMGQTRLESSYLSYFFPTLACFITASVQPKIIEPDIVLNWNWSFFFFSEQDTIQLWPIGNGRKLHFDDIKLMHPWLVRCVGLVTLPLDLIKPKSLWIFLNHVYVADANSNLTYKADVLLARDPFRLTDQGGERGSYEHAWLQLKIQHWHTVLSKFLMPWYNHPMWKSHVPNL